MDVSQLLRALGLQQAYQAYQENVGQPFANIAGPFGRGLLGLDKPEYGEEQAYRTGQAMGNMPAIGAPVGAFKAAAQVPGLLVDATHMAKQVGPELAGLLGLTAFHGSPYRFSKFDASKIGAGEGSQWYGHGLYFAESPDVAKVYKSKPNDQIKGGSFYTVDIPDQMIGRMLDWDKPLESGIIENLRNVKIPNRELKKANATDMDDLIYMASNETGDWWYDFLSNALGSDKKASQALSKAGIPGIKYFDAKSRDVGEGTRNFVVFPGNESLIRILERND